jgi:thiol:disulfide interchange protein DsbC
MKIRFFIRGLAAGLVLSASSAPVGADEAAVRASLGQLLPDVPIDSVTAAPMTGLFEVVIGSRLLYVSADGRYLLQGNLIDAQTRENLTDTRTNQIRGAAMAKAKEADMVIFSPQDPKHTITVFTDIDCGYCRKLHAEIEDFMEEGIRVRYLFYPRAGVGSPSFQKAVSVWCADDRNAALTAAKSGKDPAPKTCENPLAEQMALGEEMGVTGTPAIILEDGQMLPGYIPAKRMAAFLAGGPRR